MPVAGKLGNEPAKPAKKRRKSKHPGECSLNRTLWRSMSLQTAMHGFLCLRRHKKLSIAVHAEPVAAELEVGQSVKPHGKGQLHIGAATPAGMAPVCSSDVAHVWLSPVPWHVLQHRLHEAVSHASPVSQGCLQLVTHGVPILHLQMLTHSQQQKGKQEENPDVTIVLDSSAAVLASIHQAFAPPSALALLRVRRT